MADEQQQFSGLQSVQPSAEDMIVYANALDAALLPYLHEIESKTPVPDFEELPATDPNATNDILPPSDHQTDVEKHGRAFMEAAKKLQQYFISLQRVNKPTRAEALRKEIAAMEEELKMKDKLIQTQEKRIQDWKEELRDRLGKHNSELERV